MLKITYLITKKIALKSFKLKKTKFQILFYLQEIIKTKILCY